MDSLLDRRQLKGACNECAKHPYSALSSTKTDPIFHSRPDKHEFRGDIISDRRPYDSHTAQYGFAISA